MKTLLATVQEICGRLAQPVPNTVYGSSDKQVVQMMRLLEEGLDWLGQRGQWQTMIKEVTWLTLANEDQGSLNSATGLGSGPSVLQGYDYLLPDTLWDRTNRMPLFGELPDIDWAAMKAWIINGPRFQFRLNNDHFYVNPVPTAGWTWAMNYLSTHTILDTNGTTTKSRFTADTDLVKLPENIVMADLKWRWKKEKGLAYEEDFNTAEAMTVNALARQRPRRKLSMSSQSADSRPQIIVPQGSWNLP